MRLLVTVFFMFFISGFYSQDCEKADEFYKNDNYETALPLLKSCLKEQQEPNRLETTLKIAVSYYYLQQCDSAIKWSSKVLEIDSTNIDALKIRSGCAINQEKYNIALTDLNTIIDDLNIKNAKLYYYRGYAYYKLKKLNQSIPELKKSLEIEDGNARTNKILGYVLNDQKKYEGAIPYLKASLANGQELDLKLKQIGICHYFLNQPDSAAFYLNKSLKYADTTNQPLYENINHFLGLSYCDNNEFKKAIFHLEKAKNNDIYFKQHYVDLAFSYVQLDSVEKALEVLHKARKNFSSTPEILGQLGLTYLAHKNDTVKAQEYLLQALNTSNSISDSVNYFMELSNHLLAAGDTTNATRASNVLLDNFGYLPIVYKHRVLLLEEIDMTGYFDEIMSIFETLQDLYLEKGEKEKASYYLASRSLALLKKGDFKRSYDLINKAISYREYPEYFAVRAQVKLFMLEKEVRTKSLEPVDIEKAKEEIFVDIDKAFENNERKEAIYKTKFMSMLVFNQLGVATEEDICRVIVKANQKEKIIPQELELYFCDGIIPEDKTTGEYHYIFELSTFYDYFGEE